MKTRRALARVVVVLVMLLGVGTAQAGFEVVTNQLGTNATGILNLEVDGVLYDVEFDFDFGADIFGAPPFTFNLELQAINANEEVNFALNSVPEVVTVGPEMSSNYIIPFDLEILDYIVRLSEYRLVGQWLQVLDSDEVPQLDARTWAVFTEVTASAATEAGAGGEPEPRLKLFDLGLPLTGVFGA